MVSVYNPHRRGGVFLVPNPEPTPYDPTLLNVQTNLSKPTYYIWNSQNKNYTVNKYCELLSCSTYSDFWNSGRGSYSMENEMFFDNQGDPNMDTLYQTITKNIGSTSVSCTAVQAGAYFFFYNTSYSTSQPIWVTVKTGLIAQNNYKSFAPINNIGATYDKVLVLLITSPVWGSQNVDNYPCLCEMRTLTVATDYDDQAGSQKVFDFCPNKIVLHSKYSHSPLDQTSSEASFKLSQWPSDDGPSQSDFVWIQAKTIDSYGVYSLNYDLSQYTENTIYVNSQIPIVEHSSESPLWYTI